MNIYTIINFCSELKFAITTIAFSIPLSFIGTQSEHLFINTTKTPKILNSQDMEKLPSNTVIHNGTLTIYSFVEGGKGRQLHAPITTSEIDGTYSIDLLTEHQAILIEVKSGFIIDKETQKKINISDEMKLQSISFHYPGTPITELVTPFTNMSSSLVKYMHKKRSQTNKSGDLLVTKVVIGDLLQTKVLDIALNAKQLL